MYEKDICGFSFVNYRWKLSLQTKNNMGGLGDEAPQPPEAEILKIEITPPE